MKVSVRIFDEGQKDYLESAIRLCKRRLIGDWEFSSAADADVIFMSPQDPGVDVFLSRFLNSKEKIPVIYGDRNNTLSPWFVRRSSSKEELIPFLNNIYITLHPNEARDDVNSAPVSDFDHYDCTVERFCNTYTSLGNPVRVMGKGLVNVFYDPKREIFLGDMNTAASHLTAEEGIQIVPCQWGDIPGSLYEIATLADHKWNLCKIHGAPAQVNATDNLRLEQWPDFSRLIRDEDDINLAAFFFRYIAQPSLASARLGIAEDKVIAFCNRAMFSALLHRETETTAKTVTMGNIPAKKSKIIRTLMKFMHGDID